MLCFMYLCRWPQKHVQSLAHFYFNIELNLMWSHPNSEKILITCQARVRWWWHDNLSRGSGFNIMPINQKVLSTVAEEVWDMIKSNAIQKASFFPQTSQCVTKSLYLPLYLLTLHAQCPPLLPCHTIMPLLTTPPTVH